jgi:hypothetical protein
MIKSLWKKAREKIQDADEIYIVGFSMPASDLSVRFLFQSAFEKNKDKKVFIVNPDNIDKLKNNYSDLGVELNPLYIGVDKTVENMFTDIIKQYS